MEPKQRWTDFEDVLTNGFSDTILLENLKYANFDLGGRLLCPDLVAVASHSSGFCSPMNHIFAALKKSQCLTKERE